MSRPAYSTLDIISSLSIKHDFETQPLHGKRCSNDTQKNTIKSDNLTEVADMIPKLNHMLRIE